MRKINVNEVKKVVSALCIEANIDLRKDVLAALKAAARSEQNARAKKILSILIENAAIAKREGLAICQDTGIACVYLEVGQDVKISGGNLEKAINDGVNTGYKEGYFRNSIVDPLSRKNTGTNTPVIIHTRIVGGSKIKITVMPKGFGCENKTQLSMFKPTASLAEIKKFILDTVKNAGPDACPPFIIGIGIGGTAEKALGLSKEALFTKPKSQSPKLKALEKGLLKDINKLNIGPSGLGGKTTALSVNVLACPTHIAGLPVAVSIGCHATRSASKVI